jgi:Ca2+-binding RTX toxin-like protein
LNAKFLKEYSQLAQAAYANFDRSDYVAFGGGANGLEGKLIGDEGQFTVSEAKEFSSRFELVHQSTDELNDSGFSASLFRDKESGQLVLSIRGTESSFLGTLEDLITTDARIGIDGYASTQLIPLYRYMKELMTPKGQTVQYSATELANLQRVYEDFAPDELSVLGWNSLRADILKDKGADAGQSAGSALIGSGTRIDVAGHSLGGHLAQLTYRLFPDMVGQIVTFNAPGFDEALGNSELTLRYFDTRSGTGWAGGNIIAVAAEGDVVSKIGRIHPGSGYVIGQEHTLLGGITTNHSIINTADGLVLTEFLGKLDDTYRTNPSEGSARFDQGSNEPNAGYEGVLDDLRRLLMSPDSTPTHVNDDNSPDERASFYKNMADLQNSAAFKALAGKQTETGTYEPGQLRLEGRFTSEAARSDFAALMSLSLGNTMQATLRGASPYSAQSAALGAVHTVMYGQWLADVDTRSAGKQGTDGNALTFTDHWMQDRADMLNGIDRINADDAENFLPGLQRSFSMAPGLLGRTVPTEFEDVASGTKIYGVNGLLDHLAITSSVRFGAAGNDLLGGLSGNDALYGGDGNDTITGFEGKDWLEGNTGSDSLFGGDGSDVLLAGSDADRLVGGGGADRLYGGQGWDEYIFDSGFGKDVVQDADGVGILKIDGYATGLPTGKRVADGVYRSDDGKITYTLLKKDADTDVLLISIAGRSDTISVIGWKSGNLGINLDSSVSASIQGTIIDGDFEKKIVDGKYVYESNGSYRSSGLARPGTDDMLWGSQLGAINELMRGYGGNDYLNGYDGSDWLDGGDGNDLIEGGRGTDTVIGGAGDDVVFGNDESRSILPYLTDFQHPADIQDDGVVRMRGFSWFVTTGDVPGVVFEGDLGTARHLWTEPTSGDFIDAGAGNDTVGAGTGADTVLGGTGNDRIDGLDGRDLLLGNDGDDVIRGDGNATLPGGYFDEEGWHNSTEDSDGGARFRWWTAAERHGDDVIAGGAGNDRIFGQGADDQLNGGEGNDWISGDDTDPAMTPIDVHGSDWIDGDSGNDTLLGGGASDNLFGGDGDDLMHGDDADVARLPAESHDADEMDGGAGSDWMFGDGASDVLSGGVGDDFLFGDDAEATLPGRSHGADTLAGGLGADQLVGGGGADVISGDDGNDRIWGDDRLDRVSLAQHGGDVLSGGLGDDYIDGGGGEDSLDGGAGGDWLVGGDGADVLVSEGLDWLEGGEGDDTYDLALTAGVAPTIVDSQGVNTLKVNGIDVALSDADPLLTSQGEAHIFVQGGYTYLTIGNQLGVRFADGTDLSTMHIEDADGDTVSVEQIVETDSVGGRLRSAFWEFDSAPRWTTGDDTLPGDIIGSATADFLEGSAEDDMIDGRAGNDVLLGWAGSDVIYGDAGSDTLTGGTGADVLVGGDRSGADAETDVYVFRRGDGQDLVMPGRPAADRPKDVIRFEGGITRADIRIVADTVGTSGQRQVVIEYGANDRVAIAVGAEASVGEVQFAGSGSVSMAELLATLPAPPDRGSQIAGTAAPDILVGNMGDDTIVGLGGDDVLEGRGGNDYLQGGAGANTYYFDAASGNDEIDPTAGEHGQIVFSGTSLSNLSTSWEGSDLTIHHAGGSVRINEIAGDLANWSVKADDGNTVSFADWIGDRPTGPTPGPSTAERDAFLASQRSELASLPQRIVLDTLAWRAVAVPVSGVTRQSRSVAGGTIHLPDYLAEGTSSVLTATTYELVPVYRTQTNWTYVSDRSSPWNPVFRMPSSPQPQGSGGDMHAFDPATFNLADWIERSYGHYEASEVTRLVGYERRAFTQEELQVKDRATQTIVSGSELADRIEGGRFRGAISTFGGDDVIAFGNSSTYDFDDWAAEVTIDVTALLWVGESTELLPRGRGAWIDTGDGNDNISATDGNDIIIGGRGNDTMNGGAGSDVYLIGTNSGDVDRITDSGQLDWAAHVAASADPSIYAAYGPEITKANSDTVRFDETVSIKRLSYRWVQQVDSPSLTLELLLDGALFLQVDYVRNASGNAQTPPNDTVSTPGIETFEFADGTRYSLDSFVSAIAPAPPLPVIGTSGDDVLRGTSGNDAIFGRAGKDLISGNAGDDLLDGEDGNDSLFGDNGNDQLLGGTGNDSLNGGLGNDVLDGGAGADTMAGGGGDDVYLVERVADKVFEFADEGVDHVQASISFTLGANFENLTLTGTGMLEGTGNELANQIVGNSQANVLKGLGGNDTIDGSGGADSMTGGKGDDIYVADDAADVATESANQGNDTIRALITWTLGSNLENLALAGIADIDGTGNSLANRLTGNAGRNVLKGMAGADTIDGGAGNDQLLGAEGADSYVYGRGSGQDLVMDKDTSAGVVDRVLFGPGVSVGDVSFQRSNKDLVAVINGGADRLTIQDWYRGDQFHVEQFVFADGSTLSDTQVQGLVQAMASFVPERSAESIVPSTPWMWAAPQLLPAHVAF